MDRKYTVLRYIAYGLEILIFYIIQGVPDLIPQVLGGKPLLLIPIALTIACFENEVPAMAFGIACGGMMDLGVGTHLGFYTIALAIVCFFIGYFAENYFNTKLLIVLIISAFMIPVLISLNFVINYILAGYSNSGYYFVHHILATMAYTFVTVPVFYGINRVLSRGFNDYLY
ncbi:MAG: rod shape-determining protein MreD [Ruminococcus sp.]